MPTMREPAWSPPPAELVLPEADVSVDREELMHRFRRGVRRAVALQLAHGHPIHYGGSGDDAGRLFMRTPDGRRFEYRVCENGTHEVLRELPV